MYYPLPVYFLRNKQMARTKKTKNTDAKQLANDAIKSEQFYTLDYYQFEEIVCAYYKRDSYSFIESTETSNDTSHEFEVKKEKLEEWDAEELQDFTKNNADFCSPSILLNDLVNNDIIPEGNYLIGVSW